jgi:hypothetical protein
MSAPEPEPWLQKVIFQFVPYSEFQQLDNDILNELLKMSERVREETFAYVAQSVAFVEKYLDVLVRWHAKKAGRKLGDILKNHSGSPYHVFREAEVAEGLISEAFSDLAWKISDLRDRMIHVDEEELGSA